MFVQPTARREVTNKIAPLKVTYLMSKKRTDTQLHVNTASSGQIIASYQ